MSVYVTGDCHAVFDKLWYNRNLSAGDYVIVCGDFGLLWADNDYYRNCCKKFENVPYTVLWVDGNHENYDMLGRFEIEKWNGGLVQHIVRDKVLHLCRGQIFNIEGKSFLALGGASSHDISDGILDKDDPEWKLKAYELERTGRRMYRVKGLSWWEQELPTEAELLSMREVLKQVTSVDYIISHCASSSIEERMGYSEHNRLTDFLNEVETRIKLKHWFFGHHHHDEVIDDKHTLLYNSVVEIHE